MSCAAGKFQDQSLQTVCRDCGVGQFRSQEGGQSCGPCASGKFAPVTGRSACTDCEPGRVQTASGSAGCASCLAGQFQSASGGLVCSACLPGSFSPDLGMSVCALCTEGKHQPLGQQQECLDCGFGRYASSKGLLACLQCEAGKFSRFVSGDTCEQCKAGEYHSGLGAIQCDACPAGSFGAGQEAAACTPCAAGTFHTGTGRTTACPACLAGTFQTGLGGVSCRACTTCPSGQVWGSGCDGLADGACASCTRGTFASSTGLYECAGCGAGTYQTGARGTRCDACRACAAGSYEAASCVAREDRGCLPCAPGAFSTGLNLGACASCAGGTYQPASGGTACLQCRSCNAGFSWGDSCTATQDAQCTPCQPGTFNPSSATSTCARCAAGTYQGASGATRCLPCRGCTEQRYLASGCNGADDGVCATCTACPQGAIRACGARSDAVCRAASSVPRWLMTVHAMEATAMDFGMPNEVASLPMVGRTYVQFVDFNTAEDFSAAVPGTPPDSFVTTLHLQLTVLAGGTYKLCMGSNDGAFLDLDGVRTLNSLNSQMCANREVAAGVHAVYVQHYEHTGEEGLAVLYEGPDTGGVLILMPKQADTLVCNERPVERAYGWVGAEERCRRGEYLSAYEPGNGTSKVCRPCPEGWAGLNGIYCERCGALEEPFFLDRGACVCRAPAVMNASGACVCPDGSRQAGGGCAACGPNAYGAGGLCWACGAGRYSAGGGATACLACDFGKYRVGAMAACAGCPTAGWFAPDAGSVACVPCNASCAPGWRASRACPGGGGLVVCAECEGALPGNATWTGDACAYDCLPGFFRAPGGCLPCNASLACPAGRRLAACTEIADANCDEACADLEKPDFHSHWEEGPDCPWACDEGHELRVWDYVMFQLRECALVGSGY